MTPQKWSVDRPLKYWPGDTGSQTDAPAKPFIPELILPGGVALPLYSPDSPGLKRERIHEPERYNTSLKNKSGKTLNVLNIHNPSIEVHLAGDQPPSTGAAVIVAPGGRHQIPWVGPEGSDFVPFFKKHGVATIILWNRLRGRGCRAFRCAYLSVVCGLERPGSCSPNTIGASVR
jgi:hypothetical protein